MNTSSYDAQENNDPVVLFSDLLSQKILSLKRITEGRNSRVYQIECDQQRYYIGKLYHQSPSDPRDRLGVEYNAFSFLHQQGIQQIPRPIHIEREHNCAIYEMIAGCKINRDQIKDTDIDQCIQFLCDINKPKNKKAAYSLPNASESCFSLHEIVENIKQRLNRLEILPNSLPIFQEMLHFLQDDFRPALHRFKVKAIGLYQGIGMEENDILPREQRILSPSDFGFHNALQNKHGRIFFLDFEYFGWDDPAKAISDFLLHPAMELTQRMKRRFATTLLSTFQIHPLRLQALFPLFGLKWCMIFLNEFIRTERARRDFSLGENKDIALVCSKQLLKSKSLLHSLQMNPYVS